MKEILYVKLIRFNPISLDLIKLFIILIYKKIIIDKFIYYVDCIKQQLTIDKDIFTCIKGIPP